MIFLVLYYIAGKKSRAIRELFIVFRAYKREGGEMDGII